MNDAQLDKLIEAAAPHFRVPPPAPLDEIWDRISAERHPNALQRPASRRATWWRLTGVAAAVGLSFTLGRFTATTARQEATPAPSAATVASLEQPMAAAATQLLGQTVALLSALPAEREVALSDQRFARQAGDLLVTTRLLIDSRVAQGDPALKSLLEDLELVLAQIARLHNGESRDELDLITDALQEQDIVPRIRSVAAGLSAGAD